MESKNKLDSVKIRCYNSDNLTMLSLLLSTYYGEKGMRKFMKVLAVLVGIVLVAIIGCVLAIIFSSKGEIEPFYNEDGEVLEGSVAERVFVDINGRTNGMIIRGRNDDNPVLLFISGGPGVPQYWLNEHYDNKIEDYFTVCWWDYYGEGLSYDPALLSEDITLDQLEQDAIAVTEYLKDRFGKDKIYLMAHSGGSMLGLRLAQNDPDNFYCYFAMGQSVGTCYERCEASYPYLKEYFESTGNQKGLNIIGKYVKEENGEIVTYNKEGVQRDWENALLLAGCATTREMRSDCFGIFFPQMFSKCYTMKEKINFWKGKALCQSSSYAETTISMDQEQVAQIPVYFISGRYDYTCPVNQVEEFYKHLEAPEKEMYIFENSAHSPLWEENEAVLEAMLKHVK